MIKFTKTDVFCLLIIIVFILIQIFIKQYSIQSEINEPIMKVQDFEETMITESVEMWYIEIPKINLKANISEGITKEVLNQYIGHFGNSSTKEGNVVLGAYSNGHEVKYFKDLKLLKKGDKIIYKYNEFEKIYEVEKCRIIKDTQLEYLEETDENMLTLITHIEKQPQYRRCIQAVELKNN